MPFTSACPAPATLFLKGPFGENLPSFTAFLSFYHSLSLSSNSVKGASVSHRLHLLNVSLTCAPGPWGHSPKCGPSLFGLNYQNGLWSKVPLQASRAAGFIFKNTDYFPPCFNFSKLIDFLQDQIQDIPPPPTHTQRSILCSLWPGLSVPKTHPWTSCLDMLTWELALRCSTMLGLPLGILFVFLECPSHPPSGKCFVIFRDLVQVSTSMKSQV